MIVMKFGGSSVQDAHWIDGALSISESRLAQAPVIIASALGATTDQLEMIAENARNGNIDAARKILDGIRAFHGDTAKALLTGALLERTKKELDELFHGIGSLMKALSFLRECTDRSRGALLAFGELLSAAILSARARERGIEVDHPDAREYIRTDESYTKAIPIFHLTNRLIRETVKPAPGKLVIVQGSIGSTEKGVTTYLGKGGSDYTAAIIGSALLADAVEIWTDREGIMTSDPRFVPEAKAIERIEYEEAAELAYFGAHIIHPSTIQPAVASGIPVFIRNITDPSGSGTLIVPEAAGSGIRAIAGKEHITLITVTSSRMLNAYGFLSRIFSTFETHRTSVDLIATSEVSVSMTIENDSDLEPILQDLSEIGIVSITRDMSIICLVGRQLWKEPSFIARVFSALKSTPVRMISLGSSDINLSVVVPGDVFHTAMRLLHTEFFQ